MPAPTSRFTTWLQSTLTSKLRRVLVALWPLFLLPSAAVAVTGSLSEPFVGSPPFANLICCEQSSQCSDGDDLYENCRMPDSAIPNAKLCGHDVGEEEFPYVCDYCPGGADACDGGGWLEVAPGAFECDGPVYRGDVGHVRQIAPDTWYVGGAETPGHETLTEECNGSYAICESASCFETGCIPCASIATVGNAVCAPQPRAMCHQGLLEGSTALLCCGPNGACVRPNATTGDCSGSFEYDLTYTQLASCTPCPEPDNPAIEEICHGWDLSVDWWPVGEEELADAINCGQVDEVGCNLAVYSCDGTLVTVDGVLLEDACLDTDCNPL